jgi:hypothetical protein
LRDLRDMLVSAAMTRINEDELSAIAADFSRRLSEAVPDWANRPDHDPGVTLLEVFAFLVDQLTFRSIQLPERGQRAIARTIMAFDTLRGRNLQSTSGLERVNFFAGRRLTAADFEAEQNYLREKLRRHNRALVGAGIVTGLEVALANATADDQPVVSIGAGYAIGPDGEELSVSSPQVCRLDATGVSGFVTLRYAERPSDPMGTESAGADAPRIQEGVLIAFAEGLPDDAVALAKLERDKGAWQIVADFRPPRAGFPATRT